MSPHGLDAIGAGPMRRKEKAKGFPLASGGHRIDPKRYIFTSSSSRPQPHLPGFWLIVLHGQSVPQAHAYFATR